MGMKEEIFSIATALGYDGPTPTSKTRAVHAVAEVAGSGGGGGGDVGYDVTITKEWVVEEQTVTTEAHTIPAGTVYRAPITIVDGVDFGQLRNDGIIDFVIVVDGVEHGAQNLGMAVVTTGIFISQDPINGGSVTFETETEPTTHTVSCYYNNTTVTTTEDFSLAVDSVVSPKIDGVVKYMGSIGVTLNSTASIEIRAGDAPNISLAKDGQYGSMVLWQDSEVVEKYGEDYADMVRLSLVEGVAYPFRDVRLTNVTASIEYGEGPYIGFWNDGDQAVTLDGNLNNVSISIALFG